MGTNYKPMGALLAVLAVAVLPASAFGLDAEIGNNVYAPLGATISVPVYVFIGVENLYAFDLLIVYDAALLEYVGTTSGPLFDMPGPYEWEYFESHPETAGPEPGLIRAVGLADIDDGEHHSIPLQVNPDSGLIIILFELDFNVIAEPGFEFTESPIRYYWMDCGDNAFVPDSLGDSLAVSAHVTDRMGGWIDLTDFTYGLPGIHGTPDSCITDPSIVRSVYFFNGSVTVLPTDTGSIRGDVNCNGIPYEVADIVQFTSYFLVGLGAFGDHLVCSKVATDINADGLELTVADLVYLYRVIIGDAIPNPPAIKSGSVVATFIRDDDTKTISFDYPDSLAAIFLEFDGEIVPTLLFDVEGIVMDYGYLDGHTRILISPVLDSNRPAFVTTGGPFLSYTGSALLIDADAADYDGTVFQIQIENHGGGLTDPFGLDIGIVQDAVPGSEISIPIIKTAGTEKMLGFDILIGYEYSVLQINEASPGIPFDIPGDYEWEYFSYRFGPFDCDNGCPSGMIRVVGVAETANGPNHPSDTPIADGTVLFSLDCTLSSDPESEGTFVPVSFFWIDCGDNAIASGSYGDTLLLSDHVYDHDGIEITDRDYGFPGYYGAPDFCLTHPSNPPIRLIDFTSGGIAVAEIESMELMLSIDHVTASPGDSAVYLDVLMSNPQDSVAGFVLTINMDNPDLVEFGISPSDTIGLDFASTLIQNWEFVSTQSLTGLYHDIRITALSNTMPPYTAAIPPQQNGVLLRLIVHAYDSIPEFVTDSTTQLIINDVVANTHFSDPDGILIGVDGEGYNPQTVAFQNGSVTLMQGVYGDADGDGTVSLGDAVFLVMYIFKGGPAPSPMSAGDTNCDGSINISDAVFIINYIFKAGPEPEC